MFRTLLHMVLVCVISFLSGPVVAQISMGGIPLSISHPQLFNGEIIPAFSLAPPNVSSLLAEDQGRDRNEFNLRDAVAVSVDRGLENGHWTSHQDGSRTWRISLKVSSALSLEVNFDDLFIPEGGTLFVFNAQGTEYQGAYTSVNNKLNGRLSVEMIHGEEVLIEYNEPQSFFGQGRVHIQDLAFRYRDVLNMSQSCEVDAACSDMAIWQDVKRSVVKIRSRINGQFFWSTGTLMNNSALDCRPFILTSMSSGLEDGTFSSASDFSLYRFYFNYERAQCDEGEVEPALTIAGCMKRGDSNDDGGTSGSDYMLLELTSTIPSGYSPFYAGWNSSDLVQSGTYASIHHPSGDFKKISLSQNAIESGSWGQAGTHWKVEWSTSEIGHGVTEAGSSGAALFDGNGRVIGTLTGGSSYCEDVLPGGAVQPDFFGKLSKHWSSNPNPPNEKLRNWLDPLNTGSIFLNGSSAPCSITGIEENSSSRMKLFPNPCEGQAFLLLNAPKNGDVYFVDVFDLSGKKILNRSYLVSNGSDGIQLDVTTLENGIYLIIVRQGDEEFSAQTLVLNR